MEHKKSNGLSKLLASQPVRKMMAHLLLSVSIFSFLFSYYSLWASSPLNSRKNYFSSNSFQLPTHAMNKNYIFLICNGLLVFLAKTSGLVRSFSSSSGSFDLNDMLQKKIGDGLLTYYNISLETKEPFSDKQVFEPKEVEKRVIEEKRKEIILIQEPKEVSIFIEESDEEQGAAAAAAGSSDLFEHIEEEEKEVVFPPPAQGEGEEEEEEEEEEDDDDDDDEEDHAELLSTEELNQKFEEFIRKTKEEIMINEARQLVIVK